MKKILIALFGFFSLNAYSQENPTELAKPIVDEGKRLYRSEMASWYGTDIFLENYKDRGNIGGYFSYSDNDISKCIFYSKGDKPKVIGTITFDSTYNTRTANTDMAEREFTANETDIYEIRKIALATVNSDTLFSIYPKTSLNLVPLIYGGEKKVYALTGPSENGVVIFGNDYLMTFDKNNKLVSKKQLHKNIIPVYYGGKREEGKEVIGAIHTHLPETGDFITATDICTLMLYEKFAKWKQYQVVSVKYLNIWDCITDHLIVVPLSQLKK